MFYDGNRIVQDFPRGKKERRGYGDYSRLLVSELINDTNKVLLLDSADVLVQKDLLELYQYNIGDVYIAGTLDMTSGIPYGYKYFQDEKYINTAVLLINNIDQWRKEKFYIKSIEVAKNEKKNFICPYQDILNTVIPKEKKFVLPLKYNVMQYFENDNEKIFKTSKIITMYMNYQKGSKYRYSIEEILEADNNPIVRHTWNLKVYETQNCSSFTKSQWKKYAKMTGFYDEICSLYPIACS